MSHLTTIGQMAEEHMINAHKGIIATACHKCINIKQGIRADRDRLEEIRQAIELLLKGQ